MSEKTTKTTKELELEAYEKALKENPPMNLTELLPQPGELIVKGLSDEDKYQLAIRYLNDFGAYFASILKVQSQLYLIVRALSEKLGVDLHSDISKAEKDIRKENDDKVKEELEKLKN